MINKENKLRELRKQFILKFFYSPCSVGTLKSQAGGNTWIRKTVHEFTKERWKMKYNLAQNDMQLKVSNEEETAIAWGRREDIRDSGGKLLNELLLLFFSCTSFNLFFSSGEVVFRK